MKYIYGPVYSWRLGASLGIDPISGKTKVCTYDCVYCQIGRKPPYSGNRKIFVPTDKIIGELKKLPKIKIDYITFSGSGEPTLAKNLGDIIKAIRKIRKEKIAVLTNSSLINRKSVQKDLLLADFVAVKLDAPREDLFKKINSPDEKIKFAATVKAIKQFKRKFKGKLTLQIMFVKENKEFAKDIAEIARQIKPDQIQINTPTRPCAVMPLNKDEIAGIKKHFKGLNVSCVYESKRKKVEPLSGKATLKRRPLSK
ncbi:MAG: radical SAM protein [Candidatus Omnitrophota bacterium]